jgi:Mg2+ and Co2+ transporter CorA
MAIADATKRDSSAMKTIAIMTMAFLPATFLATLFALPVLEWEYKTDIQLNGFQLYWVLAILSTTVIFIAWALVTQRSWILNKIFKRQKRA